MFRVVAPRWREHAFVSCFAKLSFPLKTPFILPNRESRFSLRSAHSQPGHPRAPKELSEFLRAAQAAPRNSSNAENWTSGPRPAPPPPSASDRFPVDYALIRAREKAGQVYRIPIVLASTAPDQGQAERPLGEHVNNQGLFTMGV